MRAAQEALVRAPRATETKMTPGPSGPAFSFGLALAAYPIAIPIKMLPIAWTSPPNRSGPRRASC